MYGGSITGNNAGTGGGVYVSIAGALYMSRPYLSKKFKEDTGENIADFILKEKNGGSKTPPPLFG